LIILLAPDKFKGSLSAQAVGEAIARGLHQQSLEVSTIIHPLADGGDGSLEVLAQHLQGEWVTTAVTDPLGRPINGSYLRTPAAAFIEVASASGLVLLTESERNPLLTTTLGTGQLVAHALRHGARHIYLFLGGSATNDAGTGIAVALGWQFLDQAGNRLAPTGNNLGHIHDLIPGQEFELTQLTFTLLCDVNNPFCGPQGAAYVYAEQKGATPADIQLLDNGLRHFAGVLQEYTGRDIANRPGSGAAGGIAGGLAALLGAEIRSGFQTIAELTGLAAKIAAADLVISGEGRLDGQSLQGKVVGSLAELCQRQGKPLVLCVGANTLGVAESRAVARAVYAVRDQATDLADALTHAESYLEQIGKTMKLEGL